jgi:hypothetical protein
MPMSATTPPIRRMDTNGVLACITLFTFSMAPHVLAYEIDTHARMTFEAYSRSTIVSQPKIESLGLWKSRKRETLVLDGYPVMNTARLPNSFYDLLYQPVSRNATEFDHVNSVRSHDRLIDRWPFVRTSGVAVSYYLGDWLARGAVREDDQGSFLTNLANGSFWGDPNAYQQLDTANPINRFCNHFYDPVGNRALQLGLPLSVFACGSGEVFGSAVQWSLGSSSVDGAGSADAGRKNSFSLLDAREAMWRALTGTDKTDTPIILANSRAGRDAYWATSFRALGGVIHNLQDMGQPQHTRNEAHAFGPAHLLEEHVNRRILGIGPQAATTPEGAAIPPPVDFGAYPIPMFATYRQFFSTATGAGSYTGLGLANYSNRSFFTYAANFGDGQYTQPDSNSANYGTVVETNNGEFDEVYLTKTVPDSLNPSIDNASPIKMTRESLLKDVINNYAMMTPAISHQYSIDKRVIDDQVSKLIPRAVSYSTGLINFFFRGSLDIQPTSDGLFGLMDHATGTGFKKLVLKVKNTTPAITDPVTSAVVTQPMNPGKFVAVVRFHRDLAFSNDLSSAIGLGACNNLAAIYGTGNEPTAASHDPTLSTACRDGNETLVTSAALVQSLEPDEEKEMRFDFSASPISLAGVDYSLQVVFRGKLGYEDDAIATGFREMADPMFITRHNLYDYIFHGTDGSASNRNEFGVTIPSAEYPSGTNFYAANMHRYGFTNSSDFKGYGVPGWSMFGLESFVAFDYTKAMNYRYTFGPRTAETVATASAVPPGGFTRIAVLVPLWKPPSAVPTPPVRIERQRIAETAFMGETVDLWPHRHWTQQVNWQAGMRGANAWHSDGYVWQLGPFDAVDWMIGRYCLVGPRTDVQSTTTLSVLGGSASNGADSFRLNSSGGVFAKEPTLPEVQVNCQSFVGVPQSPLIPPPAPTVGAYSTASFFGTPGAWTSGYSPWDILMTTNIWSHLESPTANNQYFTPIDQLGFAGSAKIEKDGITQVMVRSKSPTPVLIAPKYR